MQENISISDNAITGTLKYVTGYTGFSSDPELQNGNFLALKVTVLDGFTTTVEVVGGYSGPVELDSDMNIVLRIESNSTQSIRVVSTNGSETITKTFNLTDLELLSE